jgi:heptosyltransferase II
MKLLIIKLGALGDVVRTTALLPAIKRKFPQSEITWMTQENASSLLLGIKEINRIVAFNSQSESFFAKESFDEIWCLDDEREVCELASKIQTKKRSGAFWSGEAVTYTSDVEEWFGMGILRPKEQGGLETANALKLKNTSTHPEIFYRMFDLPLPISRPLFQLTQKEEDWATSLYPKNTEVKKWIGVNTGAGRRWKFKSWGINQTADLCAQILDSNPNAGIFLLGGADEKERNERILDALRSHRLFQENLSGRFHLVRTDLDIRSFAAIINRCELLYTSDSLALHLGLALKKKVVVFFGPTSDREIDVYNHGEKIITPLECRGCYLKDCDIRPHCMDEISVDLAFSTISRHL